MATKKKYTVIPGVKGKVKRFDENLSNKFDVKAREVVKHVFGDLVYDNPDTYGEDIIVKCNEIPYKYFELQVCGDWDIKFPYRYPFVYARKMRFSKKTLFITFNKDFTKLLIFDRDAIDNKPTRLVKYSRELVNLVGWGKVMMMETDELSINSIKLYLGVGENSDNSDNL
jgi:hypothetical protein